jgi:undecaprenyl-diphosphatase
MGGCETGFQELVHLLVLGALQGVTEFLPVSSSAHLALLPQLFDWQDKGQDTDIFLNIGTLSVLCLYLYREIVAFTKGKVDAVLRRATPEQGFFWKVVVSSLPVICVGAIIEVFFESRSDSPLIIAAVTVLFSLLLLWCDRIPQRFVLCRYQGSLVDALLIGCAQVCSLVSGASRLGVCLSAMRFLGYSRAEAFRFSMLLSIPPVLGALTLKGIKVFVRGTALPWGAIMGGCAAAFLCGAFVLWGMTRWLLKGGTFSPFVIYRLLLAILMIAM